MIIRVFFFFFNDTATTEIYTLSLHDALPILAVLRLLLGVDLRVFAQRDRPVVHLHVEVPVAPDPAAVRLLVHHADRKSTRLNSSHANISYAVFCLKKKKIIIKFLARL